MSSCGLSLRTKAAKPFGSPDLPGVSDSAAIDGDNSALAPVEPAEAPSPANKWEKGMPSPNPKGRKPIPIEVKRA